MCGSFAPSAWGPLEGSRAGDRGRGAAPPRATVRAVTDAPELLEIRGLETYFHTDEGTTKAVDGIDLTVHAGRTLALVGPSGAGKSTIVSLLLRFYDPAAGTVRFDGVDVRLLEPRWLRQQCGVVMQEPTLFAGTIRQNLCYGLQAGGDDPGAGLEADAGSGADGSDADSGGETEAATGGKGGAAPDFAATRTRSRAERAD